LKQLTTFIFDVGGVLIRHDNDLLFDRLAACCKDPSAVRPQLDAAMHDPALGTGRRGVDALHAQLVAEHGFSGTYAHFLQLWSSHFSAEPGMEALLGALASRYRVVLFSNTNAPHWEHIMAHYPVLHHAHALYLSHELGLVKPDPAAFRKVLELERCEARDSVFIDDRAEHTAAAAALGIHAVTFTGRDDLLRNLTSYGINGVGGGV
jgi:glucose-1-phosphatase